MKRIQNLSLISTLVFWSIFVYGQSSRSIVSKDRTIGNFNISLIHKAGSQEKVIKDGGVVEFDGSIINSLFIRIKDLAFTNSDYSKNSLRLSKKNLKSSSNCVNFEDARNRYNLDGGDKSIEIPLNAQCDGKVIVTIPYEIKKVAESLTRYEFQIKGLVGQNKISTKSLVKEWSGMDKSDVKALVPFYLKMKDGEDQNSLTSLYTDVKNVLSKQKEQLRKYSRDNDFTVFYEIFPDEKEKLSKRKINNVDKTTVASLEKDNSNNQAKEEIEEAEDPTAKSVDELEKIIEGENAGSDNPTVERLSDNTFRININNAEDFKALNITQIQEIKLLEQKTNYYDIEVSGNGKYDLKFKHAQKEDSLVTIQVDNTFEVLNFEDKDNSFLFYVSGGVSPYRVDFVEKDKNRAKSDARIEDLVPNKNGIIFVNKADLEKKGLTGPFNKIIIFDKITNPSHPYPINWSAEKDNSNTFTFIVIALLALIGGGTFIYLQNKKKEEKRKAYLDKAKAIVNIENESNASPEPVVAAAPMRKISIAKTEKAKPAYKSDFKSSGKMKITWKDNTKGTLSKEDFSKIIAAAKFCKLNLQELWPDSAVSELYMSEDCIKELGAFLREENLERIVEEKDGTIPEVGGFLMGNHYMEESNDSIVISIDKFVPFVPEYHDVFKIEIGTQTLVQELGDAQDNNPNLDLIGWFHTHPGHGLFLSNSDLSVQGHFPQQFQVAMEIDSLTERLDTAFFTRKKNGKMNNVGRIRDKAWFAWKEIEKSIA